MRHFGFSSPTFITNSEIATIWRVRYHETDAALKVYHDADPKDEWPGVTYIESRQGVGAARIYGITDGAILMEWLPGLSVAQITEQGDDDRASQIIADTFNELHSVETHCDLPLLLDRLDALMHYQPPMGWSAGSRASIRKSQEIAQQRINAMPAQRPLHGDLHHANIHDSARGFVAFDAKGLLGDPAYDLANAFRNPLEMPDLVCAPDRIMRMAQIFARTTGIPASTILDWAIIHSALTIAWENPEKPDMTLLDKLIEVRSAIRQ
ncbi:aminoglycoside phosphotransferase family protein [Loktanella sp. S4079]|uniref:aminoglycoside phosphotransferase family protein n=1 Tax=Loktanella sp. S4079 TaxID=579483 RepID=UPI00069866A5|nr:aminoglycoside phosphotransferase family protein [Loktanella sp. S4079]